MTKIFIYVLILLKGGINIRSKETEAILQEAKNGDWRKIIELQTSPYGGNQAEMLKGALSILSRDKISSELIENETVYLVVLFRYFGTKPVNNGFYFKEKKDAKDFIEQYKEMMGLYPHLIREEGEKIAIIEIKLCQREEVL